MKFISKISVLLIVLSSLHLSAQDKYWVYFDSKTGFSEVELSGDSLKAQRNLPIFQPYLDSLQRFDIVPVVSSKWLNAITTHLTDEQYLMVKQLHFVKKINATRKMATTLEADNPDLNNNKLKEGYASALKQIDAEILVENGFSGEGVDIGIIDGGFLEANEYPHLSDVFNNNRFIDFKDFTGENYSPFGGQKSKKDDHGTRVWKNIAGFDHENDRFYGLARNANYFLAKSDRGDVEFRGEEDYWIAALEWMDSKGVKIINSSLGYSTGFDDPNENYDPQEVDGHTSPLTQASQIAANEKGMLIIASAGNDGNKSFQVLSVPADAQDIITVGSCTSSGKKISHSSVGPESLEYIKPDVCCFSLGGTSFAAPIITGLAAGIKQQQPSLTNFDIMEIIKRSSHLYPYGNNHIGFGIPNGKKVLQLIADKNREVWDAEEMKVVGDLAAFKAEGLKKLPVYHKKNEYLVLKSEELIAEEDEFIVAKPSGAVRTTLAINGKVWEIFWQ